MHAIWFWGEINFGCWIRFTKWPINRLEAYHLQGLNVCECKQWQCLFTCTCTIRVYKSKLGLVYAHTHKDLYGSLQWVIFAKLWNGSHWHSAVYWSGLVNRGLFWGKMRQKKKIVKKSLGALHTYSMGTVAGKEKMPDCDGFCLRLYWHFVQWL